MPRPRSLVHQLITERIDAYPELYPPEAGTFDVLEGQQRAQAEAVYKTVIQRWLTLRALLNKGLKKPIRRMESPLAAILMTAAAEILFMEGSPDYAVTHEAVEAAKAHREGAAGLVNAALRRLIEIRGEYKEESWQGQKDAVPHRDGILTFTAGSLPDPKMGDSWMSVVYSHPIELISRWKKLFAPMSKEVNLLQEILPAHLQTPDLYVHYPPPRDISTEHYEESETSHLVRWHGDRRPLWDLLRQDPLRYWVQDLTAYEVAAAINPCHQQGTVLDYCAGRGTKTRALLYRWPKIKVIATDIDQDRFEDLKQLEACSDRLTVVDFQDWQDHPQVVDTVLLDCPCTNSGTLRRRLEARYRLGPEMVESMRKLQLDILNESSRWVKPGGHLIYSTCSIEPEENSALIQDWLLAEEEESSRDWTLALESHSWPALSQGRVWKCDGGYHGVLERVE